MTMAPVTRMSYEAPCAYCHGTIPDCKCEDKVLEKELKKAQERWLDTQLMRTTRHWVLDHARQWILFTYNTMVTHRIEQYQAQVASLPCYNLYKVWNGRPPIQREQLAVIHNGIAAADRNFQDAVGRDWVTSLERYPDVLDYYFGLVQMEVLVPKEEDPEVKTPVFGAEREGSGKREKRRARYSLAEGGRGGAAGFGRYGQGRGGRTAGGGQAFGVPPPPNTW